MEKLRGLSRSKTSYVNVNLTRPEWPRTSRSPSSCTFNRSTNRKQLLWQVAKRLHVLICTCTSTGEGHNLRQKLIRFVFNPWMKWLKINVFHILRPSSFSLHRRQAFKTLAMNAEHPRHAIASTTTLRGFDRSSRVHLKTSSICNARRFRRSVGFWPQCECVPSERARSYVAFHTAVLLGAAHWCKPPRGSGVSTRCPKFSSNVSRSIWRVVMALLLHATRAEVFAPPRRCVSSLQPAATDWAEHAREQKRLNACPTWTCGSPTTTRVQRWGWRARAHELCSIQSAASGSGAARSNWKPPTPMEVYSKCTDGDAEANYCWPLALRVISFQRARAQHPAYMYVLTKSSRKKLFTFPQSLLYITSAFVEF